MKSRKHLISKIGCGTDGKLLLYTPHKYTIRGDKIYKWWEYMILDTDEIKKMKYTITRELREYHGNNGVHYLWNFTLTFYSAV